MEAKVRGARKTQVGTVVSDKMEKTVVVSVDRKMKHPLYGKYIRRRSTYKVHDEHQTSNVGDKVLIMESRPYSKGKRWRMVKVLEKAV
jgi:small subunit ribosomal protein S17